ncbi:hypothetical protein AN1327.2 [Aspergillus nidulans FGSC A4]|uniref:Uncharacterized protein n=1 Tax=Emericella nidulans (strain FGSC A4 / ATCC 38163 / CBS 112.46 / NRRL 194 / M139) TaxID=227321 RepID=Q5BDQ3_EMENI|nr:hypothetical protein [Aspergillus nidulans FGSC A4]EAA65510.1 hypothetical protein AN1327.2 [Aspergillus nidulans FGSC A4]CBF87710.1 TPA: hypothetical protein ANIA_01327 [Aspergillus nidulans FGSC A4]|eukprot:XP_658931.1 hypothetical protein AN1327.2 [Aspergillus nidulans FGSC A4]
MDPDEAPPPPYSAVDPLLAPSTSNRNVTSSSAGTPSLPHIRDGDAQLHNSRGSMPIAASAALPTHFTSAAAYFAERPPPALEDAEQVLEHHITIYPRSQAKDFPRRPRCWSPRMENVTQQDWDMFLRHLFPPHLGLASSSAELPRQVRAEIRRDRKDRPQETDEEREMRIATVMKEWNQYFFEPRAVRIVFFYVTDPRNAPISPLCPRCYPAATRASQENRGTQVPETGRGHPLPGNMHPTITGYPQAPMYPGQVPGPYGWSIPNPAPYPPQQGSGFFHPANPHVYHYQYPQWQPWGWGTQHSQQYESSILKGGPLGWFSSLAAQAQKYGDRISEQALHYGDQITAHAQYYGSKVEEQAMAHGRWIEEQAGLSGRKAESAFSGWNQPPQAYPHYYPQPQPQHQSQTSGTAQYTQQSQSAPETTVAQSQQLSSDQQPQQQPQQSANSTSYNRPRRDSTSSTTSDSSLSSIDSISTTSDLSSSDLATVRAQLLSLSAHHDRELYDAAVELRRQLDALRESRRQARVSSTRRWRPGWGQSRSDQHSTSQSSHQGRSSWGRWESPADRQRNQAERRAAKEELRATRKAFRDVVKRAREEQKESRRAKKARRRQERRERERRLAQGQNHGQEETASEAGSVPAPLSESNLEQRLQNLELGSNSQSRAVSAHITQRADADAGSESSAISSIKTPSANSEEEPEPAKEKGKEQKPSKGTE